MCSGKFSEQAHSVCESIRYIVEHKDALDNLESYLEYCFADWLTQFVDNNVDNFVAEIYSFAHICDAEI